MTDDKNTGLKIIEAILFANSDLVNEKDLLKNIPKKLNIKKLLGELKDIYKSRGINIYNVKNKWGFRTAPSMANYLKIEKNLKRKLSKAGVETLAIIAYYQPVTKGEIEKVRARHISQGTLDILLERGWIELKGRRKTPGKPLTWGTTDKFLEHFNLTDLKELPTIKEINQLGIIEKKRG
jgi:segregation and condensation protein B